MQSKYPLRNKPSQNRGKAPEERFDLIAWCRGFTPRNWFIRRGQRMRLNPPKPEMPQEGRDDPQCSGRGAYTSASTKPVAVRVGGVPLL